MKALACCYWPVDPCTNIVRTWRTLPAPSQTHSWWDLDSARAALCHTTAFNVYGQNFYLFGCMEN